MKSHSLTNGSIAKSIFFFALPLIAGNFLQQFYNTFDSIIVGNVVGEAALAAVGATTMLVNLLLALYQGASTGAGILIARFYGGGEDHRKELNLSVRVTVTLSFVLGALIMAIGLIFSPTFLRWMNTPDEIFDSSVLYLRIFFAGMIFNVVYNMGAGILNAVGNSRRSLIYLAVASITNILLDILLVAVLQMGVAGAAYATIISQAISAVLVLLDLSRPDSVYTLRKYKSPEEDAENNITVPRGEGISALARYYRPACSMARRIITIGLPTSIQSGVIVFSNVLIQAGVNAYGTRAVAGFSAYLKIDGFNILPVFSFSLAATTFVSQNIGAGRIDRAKKGTSTVIWMSVIYTAVIGVLMLFFAEPVLRIFTRDAEAIHYGVLCAYSLAPVYPLLAVIHSYAGAIRGAGRTLPPMVILLLSLCLFRVCWIWWVAPHFEGIMGVYLTYTVSIILGAILMTSYAKIVKWLPEYGVPQKM